MSALTDEQRAFIASKSPANDETEGWEYALLHRAVEMVVRECVAAAFRQAGQDFLAEHGNHGPRHPAHVRRWLHARAAATSSATADTDDRGQA